MKREITGHQISNRFFKVICECESFQIFCPHIFTVHYASSVICKPLSERMCQRLSQSQCEPTKRKNQMRSEREKNRILFLKEKKESKFTLTLFAYANQMLIFLIPKTIYSFIKSTKTNRGFELLHSSSEREKETSRKLSGNCIALRAQHINTKYIPPSPVWPDPIRH